MTLFLITFITIAGFIIGLGAVTVIDLHGFLGRNSSYWTEATIRTHKITKPLIWVGITLVLLGTLFAGYHHSINFEVMFARVILIIIMIANGCFLSFVISPDLINREREGREKEILPLSMQRKITVSFLISFITWWGLLAWTLWSITL